MTLRAYLDATGETVNSFAKKAGLPSSTLSRYMGGQDVMGSTIKKIVIASGRIVTANEIIGISAEPLRRKAKTKRAA